MRDRRVRGDDQIELRDHGRRIGEIAKLTPEMKDIGAPADLGPVVLADPGVEADEEQVSRGQDRLDLRKLERAATILLERWIAAPHDPDA